MIFLLLLAVPPAPQAPPVRGPQAALHSPHAVLYAELPDLPGLLSAYGDAPAARMLADPEVRAAMAELMSSIELDLDSILDQVCSSAGLPSDLVRHPVQSLQTQLGKVSGVSFSVSIDESRPGEFAETLTRMHATTRELQALEDALYLYAVDHAGRFPATLVELGEQGLASDPWGGAYVYTLLPDEMGFELTGRGADGAPGGRGSRADLEVGADFAALLAPELADRLGLTLVASFLQPEDAGLAMDLLRQVATKAGLQQTEGYLAEAQEGVDLVWYSGEWEAGAATRPWMLTKGGLLAIGAGSSTPTALLARSAGGTRSALDSAGYESLEARFGGRGGATVTRAFVDFADMVEALAIIDPIEGINWTLFAAYSRSAWRSALESGRFVTESYTQTPEEDNVLAHCVAHEPVPESIWKFIPNDAIGMYATSVDARKLYDMIIEVIQEDFDKDHVSKLSKLEEKYGFSLAEDVVGSIGAGAAGYLLPISGLLSLPGVALVAQLEDPARFQKGLEGLLKLLEDEAGGDFQIEYRPYRDAPLWFFSFQGGPPIPISPSLVIVDDHLLVTLTSTRAKKEIKRILDLAEPEAAEPGAAEPESHGARSRAPAEATFVGYMDWAQLFEGAYDGAKGALAMMGGQLELPFDTTALPEAELFTRFFEPSIYWTEVQDDAVYSRGESSFGPETLLGLGGLAGAGALGFRAVQAGLLDLQPTDAEVAVSSTEVEVSESSAPEPAAALERTRDTLRFLATRLAVYKLEKGNYPDRLERLLEATENYPRGFLDGRELPLDGWQASPSYSVTADGSSYRLWSKGPDGVDQSGEGDDLVN